jgi:hypothetical protein
LIEAENGDPPGMRAVLSQIPRASSLAARSPVVLLGTAVVGAGLLRRLLGGGTVRVARATRCTALVILGYVDVGAGVDPATGSDLAWGWSS